MKWPFAIPMLAGLALVALSAWMIARRTGCTEGDCAGSLAQGWLGLIALALGAAMIALGLLGARRARR